jgi:hypothetical protein
MFTQSQLPRVLLPRFAEDNTESVSSGATGSVLIALKFRYTKTGIVTQSRVLIDRITMATEAAKNTTFKIIFNPTTLSAESTSDYEAWGFEDETDSLMLVDTTIDTYTGGEVRDEFILAGDTSMSNIYERGDLELQRGDVLIVHASFASGTSSDCSVGITWVEDI